MEIVAASDRYHDKTPLIWLLGKTGAGKSSIAATLAGAPADIVGDGFDPTTRTSTAYGFPVEEPTLQFLDTRGFEDGGSLSASDFDATLKAAALLVVVVRASDRSLASVLNAVRSVRRQRPGVPIIIAQTWLHDLYGDADRHVEPYPFDGTTSDFDRPGVAANVGAALAAQRALLGDIGGAPAPRFVPLDFTRTTDGLHPQDYGADALWEAIAEAAPAVVAAMSDPSEASLRVQVVLPWATAAAASDAAPLPVVGGIGATSLQAGMIRVLARRYGLKADRKMLGEFASVLGLRFALAYAAKFLARQVLKLAPPWGGMAVGAWSFVVTWGLGEAAMAFCKAKSRGDKPDHAAIAKAYEGGLRRGRQIASASRRSDKPGSHEQDDRGSKR